MRSKLLLLSVAAVCLFTAATSRAQTYAITNAKIVTVSGATIDRGTVVIRNGLIQSVGANAAIPSDAQAFDVNGSTVYPGFIDALTNLGIAAAATQQQGGRPNGGGGGGQQQAQQAAPASNSNYPAALRPETLVDDEIRAGDPSYDASRNAGITTVLTVSRSGIFNGQSAVIDLAGDSVSEMILRSPFGEHVTYTTAGFGTYPGSLMGTFSALRQMFYDAQRLQTWQKMYASDPKGIKRPEADKSLEALFPLLNRQMPIVFNANTEREIVRSLDFIKEFNLLGVIAGGQEAWKQSDRLKAMNVPVILSLNFPKRTAANAPDADPDPLELLRFRAETPKGAGRLAAAGVKFAFTSGGAAPADFFANAGKAVDGGLSRDAAIRAMTLGSAELLGIADRTGSIEPGKIANLVVIKGDVFGRDKFASHVFVDGKYFEQKEPTSNRGARGPGGGVNPGGGGGGPQLTGSYNITVEIPGQPTTGTLTLQQDGTNVTGSLNLGGSVSPVKGQATAGGFNLTSSVTFQGTSLNITLNGSLNGNNIVGNIDSPAGAVSFSGTKNP
ncbi:MAG: amidohydrolase family protein [Acidobacteria bacterium]|nr:amidohydrolase family protein [Acidobacteriota bacterium]